MNLEIERIAISLQGVSAALGERVAGVLEGALKARLSTLKLNTAGNGIALLDLGLIDAPAHADEHLLTELIASRLVDWVGRQHSAEPGTDARPGEGR